MKNLLIFKNPPMQRNQESKEIKNGFICCTITRVEVLSIGTDNKCVDSRYANTEGIQSMHVIQLSYIYAILNEDN
ncbi:hypothetical protein BLOT_014608 [Blomia tropicalis]|nr:hypothetical protein BLOT_014608 [Blomia tropicalis]